jgi:hypothetical protein
MAVAVWWSMAVLNLAAGVWVSTWPDRQSDLDAVQRSGQEWLVHGANIYESAEGAIDYPPHAILILSPLALVPPTTAFAMWSIANLALAILAVYLCVRTAAGNAALSTLLAPMAMCLCWGGFRTLLQFTLLSLTCAVASMRTAGSRPVWSGVLLGLALMKPQVALPFVLWSLFTRRWRTVSIAAAAVALGVGLYCLRAQRNPLHVVVGYLAALRGLYTGPDSLSGLSEMRPLIALAVADSTIVDGLAATCAGALLLAVCALASREARSRPTIMISLPALAAVWSLLAFRHLTYGFILLLPVTAMLLWLKDEATEVNRIRIMWWLQAALMVDLPMLGRWLEPFVPSNLGTVLSHADRLLALALFVALVRLIFERRGRPFGPAAG